MYGEGVAMVARDDQKLCGFPKTQSGRPCRNYRGFKTDHPGYGRCYKHGGMAPNGRTVAAREVVAEVLAAVEQKRTPFYGEVQPITARDALREELARSRSIVQHLEAMLGAEIGGIDPGAGSAGLTVAQLETLKALHVERLHYSRISETVVRLDLDSLDASAVQRMGDRMALSVLGFIRELGHKVEDPGVRAAARNFIDACIALTDDELREYAGNRGNDILSSSNGRGMGT
jgi:hypothetical protein